jgi:hypothetical protein
MRLPHSYLVGHKTRVFITIGMKWLPGTRGFDRRCPTVLRNVTSATVLAGRVKLLFPIEPAFAGVCRSGVWLQVSPNRLV